MLFLGNASSVNTDFGYLNFASLPAQKLISSCSVIRTGSMLPMYR